MRKILLVLNVLVFAILAGCGEKKELVEFHDSINAFYTEVSNIEGSMELIDEYDEKAVTKLQVCMEQMKTQFQALADIKVPDEFTSVESLADDAYHYMSEAVRLYSEAYKGEIVEDTYVQAAVENYDSAMKRVNYIAVLLQGEIPDEATVVEEEGNEFEPYTEE